MKQAKEPSSTVLTNPEPLYTRIHQLEAMNIEQEEALHRANEKITRLKLEAEANDLKRKQEMVAGRQQ